MGDKTATKDLGATFSGGNLSFETVRPCTFWPRLPRSFHWDCWRGNRSLDDYWISDGCVIFRASAAVFILRSYGCDLDLTFPSEERSPVSGAAIAEQWGIATGGAVTELEFVCSIVQQARAEDDGHRETTVYALLRHGLRMMHFNAFILRMAFDATRADGLAFNSRLQIPHVLLMRAGAPVALVVGMRDRPGCEPLPLPDPSSRLPGIALADALPDGPQWHRWPCRC